MSGGLLSPCAGGLLMPPRSKKAEMSLPLSARRAMVSGSVGLMSLFGFISRDFIFVEVELAPRPKRMALAVQNHVA